MDTSVLLNTDRFANVVSPAVRGLVAPSVRASEKAPAEAVSREETPVHTTAPEKVGRAIDLLVSQVLERLMQNSPEVEGAHRVESGLGALYA
ncbi:MAG: hypothetical protein HQL57_07535 [Magnetococcales bacterium]|nr:hypothetical protein [Magnetococcales bacterium]MBF0157017.1 hypothetical protein [Magnetococcales bacterium]